MAIIGYNSSMNELVSVAEAARRLGIAGTTLRRWARQGYIPVWRVGHTWAVEPARLEALLQAGLLPPRRGRVARWREGLLELAAAIEQDGGVTCQPVEAAKRFAEALEDGDRASTLLALADVVYCAARLGNPAPACEAAEKAGLDFDTAVRVAVAKYQARLRNITTGTSDAEQAELEAVLAAVENVTGT